MTNPAPKDIRLTRDTVVVEDAYGRTLARRGRRFSRAAVERIAYQFAATIEEFDAATEWARLRDDLGRLLWVYKTRR